MPFLNRVHRRIWWLTVSKAADRSSKISNEDLEAVLASLRSSTTESKAVSVECPLLKPDWLLSRRLFFVRKALTWLNTTRSSDLLQKAYGKQKMASEKSTKTPAVLDVNTQKSRVGSRGRPMPRQHHATTQRVECTPVQQRMRLTLWHPT